MTASLPKDAQADAFWAWFQDHLDDLPAMAPPTEADLRQRLGRFSPYLDAELLQDDDGTYEFVLTAGGVVEAFPAVVRLAAHAPPISGWRIVAFRPRRDAPLELEMGDALFTANNLWFKGHREGQRLNVRFYHDGPDVDEDLIWQAVFFLVDDAVGEYASGTRLGEIALHRVAADRNGLQPFSEFRAWFDAQEAAIDADDTRRDRIVARRTPQA